MRLTILSSMILSVLALATGCSATSSSQVARGTTPAAVDTSDDAWTPPEAMDLAIRENKVAQQPKTEVAGSMPTPNKRPIVTGVLRTTN